MKDDENLVSIAKALGAEHCTMASKDNPLLELIVGSKLGDFTTNDITEMTADANSDLISDVAMDNYFKFYPSGTSLQQILHFRQMLIDGEFKKYDY